MSKLIDLFEKEVDVEYKGEKYSVRDNGTILRHPKNENRLRQLDNIWTFGKIDKQKGYLTFSSDAVHRIVATAFLGTPPDKSYVVDHKDTNKQNNRPENLRWVTRLENILLNDITRTKIELICGMPISDVLADISILQNKDLPTNIGWMKTVSPQEASKSLTRWNEWCKEVEDLKFNEDARERYFRNRQRSKSYADNGFYPFEPKNTNSTLEQYSNRLEIGEVFYSKTFGKELNEYIISDFYYNEQTETLTVATTTEGGIKNLYLTTVTKADNDFQYETRSFFDPNGIEKYMTIAKGFEWTGGDVFDDYC